MYRITVSENPLPISRKCDSSRSNYCVLARIVCHNNQYQFRILRFYYCEVINAFKVCCSQNIRVILYTNSYRHAKHLLLSGTDTCSYRSVCVYVHTALGIMLRVSLHRAHSTHAMNMITIGVTPTQSPAAHKQTCRLKLLSPYCTSACPWC